MPDISEIIPGDCDWQRGEASRPAGYLCASSMAPPRRADLAIFTSTPSLRRPGLRLTSRLQFWPPGLQALTTLRRGEPVVLSAASNE